MSRAPRSVPERDHQLHLGEVVERLVDLITRPEKLRLPAFGGPFRVDNFPYGGSKDSGLGREGVRFAMDEMTEPRVLVMRGMPS